MNRILLAENDGDVARALTRRLELWGWDVTHVASGTEAVKAAREERPNVLLLDLRLPGLDGIRVLRELRSDTERPPVVVMSGFLDDLSTRTAIELGASEVLEKPVEPGTLQAVLRDVTAAKSMAPANASDVQEIVGVSKEANRLRREIKKVAPYADLPLLIIGETGAGKEVIANALHHHSRRRGKLVAINCAAMPESLFESELFGHASGSFTGAKGTREGLFEAAAEGTLFLDEVGELPAGTQAKLLRVLETRRFRPVGSNREIELKARIVSATNRPLVGAASEALRSDLYFRLAGYRMTVAPLRARLDDIPSLANHFLAQLGERHPGASEGISAQALCALQTHRWPGNVRELRTVLFSALVNAAGRRIEVRHVVRELQSRGGPARPEKSEPAEAVSGIIRCDLPSLERSAVELAYDQCDGNLSAAARMLNIPRTTLRNKLRRYSLR